MSDLLIRNATIVNEDQIYNADVKISNGIIEQIGTNLSDSNVTETINADGLHLLPGVIDDQVHFREPGATHKATIASESRAAVAGGTTSFMDMPNTSPQTTDQEQFNAKLATAAATSVANYGFFLGATNSNLEEIKKVDPRKCPGIKIFMGSSTGNMLVDHQNVLEDIFRESPVLIATHCEKPEIISANEQKAREKYGEDVPVREHPNIRSRTACIESTRIAFNLAKKHHADLHILHLSTREEVELLSELKQIPFAEKHITAEACTPHIAFTDSDYEQLGTRIKCNAVGAQKQRGGSGGNRPCTAPYGGKEQHLLQGTFGDPGNSAFTHPSAGTLPRGTTHSCRYRPAVIPQCGQTLPDLRSRIHQGGIQGGSGTG